MRKVLLFLVLITSGCTQTSNAFNNELMKKFEVNGYWENHCGGVNIPICKYYVYGVKKDRTREYQLQGVKWIGETLLKSMLGG